MPTSLPSLKYSNGLSLRAHRVHWFLLQLPPEVYHKTHPPHPLILR